VATKVHIFIQTTLTSLEKEKCVKTLNYNNRRSACRTTITDALPVDRISILTHLNYTI